ncbi:MAG: hypothetical protein WBV46_20060, partial [Terriglobales bacterium]
CVCGGQFGKTKDKTQRCQCGDFHILHKTFLLIRDWGNSRARRNCLRLLSAPSLLLFRVENQKPTFLKTTRLVPN